jgi:hypothetical protein
MASAHQPTVVARPGGWVWVCPCGEESPLYDSKAFAHNPAEDHRLKTPLAGVKTQEQLSEEAEEVAMVDEWRAQAERTKAKPGSSASS